VPRAAVAVRAVRIGSAEGEGSRLAEGVAVAWLAPGDALAAAGLEPEGFASGESGAQAASGANQTRPARGSTHRIRCRIEPPAARPA